MKIEEFGNLKIAHREEACDEAVVNDNFKADIFFGGVPEYKPKDDDTIIDVGAHIGAFSVIAASKVKNGKVYAIEPSRESFEYLKRNIALNNFSNVFAYNLALAGSKGVARLYFDLRTGNWGHTLTKELSREYEEVRTDTLSNFIRDNGIKRCDFMKLNCEGSEFEIILNTPKEILSRIRIMLILYHLDLVEGRSEKDLAKHLKKCGFFVTFREKSEQRGWIIAGRTMPFCVMTVLYTLRYRWDVTINKWRRKLRKHFASKH